MLGVSTTSAAPRFAEEVAPLLAKYCYSCHGEVDAKGHLNLEQLPDEAAYLADHTLLENLEWVLDEMEMPPGTAPLPTHDERELLSEWVRTQLLTLRESTPDDPGVVVMPRLTRAAYRNVIREVTGHTYPVDELLPPDSAAGEGFTNVGEAQTVSPVDVEKYLAAAESILAHARISPATGITWFPVQQPAIEEQQVRREELVDAWARLMRAETEKRVEGHWERVKAETGFTHAAYLRAAWAYRFRNPDEPERLEDFAHRFPTLDPVFLAGWWRLLWQEEEPNAYLSRIIEEWRQLPGDLSAADAEVRFERLEAQLVTLASLPRFGIAHRRSPIEKDGDPNLLRREMEEGRRLLELDLTKTTGKEFYLAITPAGDSRQEDFLTLHDAYFTFGDGRREPWTGVPAGRVQAPATIVVTIPQDAIAFEVEGRIDLARHPDAALQFTALETAPAGLERDYLPRYPIIGGAEGSTAHKLREDLLDARRRLLLPSSAQTDTPLTNWFVSFHEMDLPLFSERLSDGPQADNAPYRYQDTDLLAALPQEAEALREAIAVEAQPDHRKRQLLLMDHGMDGQNENLAPTKEMIDALPESARATLQTLNERIAMQEEADARKAHSILAEFSGALWRRPASEKELTRLLALYHRERRSGSAFDPAVKTALSAAMLAPHFLYRWQANDDQESITLLSDHELAERLAFVLWSAPPDEALLELADQKALHQPEILRGQIRRMLDDPRIESMAVEFFGHWLGFAEFEQHDSPDPRLYEAFTPEIRSAMQAEAIHFFTDLLRSDRPLNQIVQADYTWLNEELAAYYGVPGVEGEAFRRVNIPGGQRGGLFGMGSILTRTSTPLRTSPVIRGTWIVTQFLGEPMPEPPPGIPPISEEETNAIGQTIPEQLAAHRANPTCAGCHNRIDPPGLALEQFDAIGRWRNTDAKGDLIEAEAELQDGTRFRGLNGLRQFATARQEQWFGTVTRKFVAYALGRPLLPTDHRLIEATVADLLEVDDSPSRLIEAVLISPQFRQRRNDPIDQ